MSDSATKRKANGPPDAEGGSRSAKRQKPGAADGSSETVETTTEKGLDFIRTMRAAKDKTGRNIIDEFLVLPSAAEVPGYYDQIRLPIAIETIENKLNNGEYSSLTALESDFKRMVQNAKDFNDKRSSIYEDAERVRKGASNWFVRNNPAYSDRNYVARPTPVPGDSNGTPATPATPTPAHAPISLKITNKAAPARTPVASSTPVLSAKEEEQVEEEDVENEDVEMDDGEENAAGETGLSDFTGKTFQKAQEQLVQELLDYTESDSDLLIFTPFHFLPPRSLLDYYQVIKYPVSLKAVQKRVRGIHGRAAPTNVSDFQSWDALAHELSFIWLNCREYNEDGSEMFNLAGEFEAVCKRRLALARAQVEQPAQPKIKLSLGGAAAQQAKQQQPPSIKLKFGAQQAKGSPGPAAGGGGGGGNRSSAGSTPAAPERRTPGITVDGDALQRQKDMVAAASVNGARAHSSTAASRNPLAGSRSGSAATGTPGPGARGSPVRANGVKAEGMSPALSAVRAMPVAGPGAAAMASMLPPTGARPLSGSPHPQLQPPGHSGAAAAAMGMGGQYQPPPAVNGFMQSKLRPAGQTIKDSILPSLTILSHPGLQTSNPFKQTVKAHPRLIEQSFTYTVPASKHSFHIVPYLPPSVTSRAYRIFVLVNGLRLSPQPARPGEEQDRGRPVYEARLERGAVGRIEVEVLAEKRKVAAEKVGAEKAGEEGEKVVEKKKDEVDREKVTVFVHVMRS